MYIVTIGKMAKLFENEKLAWVFLNEEEHPEFSQEDLKCVRVFKAEELKVSVKTKKIKWETEEVESIEFR